tara:strand:- start:102 stop:503 length:402 start_codon:yes stop_codon:yes gene_type:complete
MARLLQLNHDATTTAARMTHPRTGKNIRKFGLKRVCIWNEQGTVGGAFNINSENSGGVGLWGVVEIYDSTSTSPAAGDLVMRIPVSGKSRLTFDLPDNGIIFKDGVVVDIGSEKSNNGSKPMSIQLLGYEYSV